MEGAINFAGESFQPAGQAALCWPAMDALLVSDLHLEKASSFAKGSGQMLPPYDSAATLQQLREIADDCAVSRVICLGDNFHDNDGERRLAGDAADILSGLTRKFDWHWIVGNHDPALGNRWGGAVHDEMQLGGIMLRHNVVPGDPRTEISGHYHPKIKLRLRGRRVSRRCFLQSGNRLVMPAFGALTGGMDVADICPMLPGDGDPVAWVSVRGRFVQFALAAV